MSEGSLLDANFYALCLSHLAEVRELDFVVAHSLPIPFFGDLAAYLASPLRVLTAALNPSDREFPLEKTPRFDVAMGLRGPAELEAQLSAYFSRDPYRSWFSAFEPVLNGLEASYGGKMANEVCASTALHVDMCSPIATSPTWSKMTAGQRANLTSIGRDIFEWLINEIEPDIIVASLGWGHLETWNAEFEAGRRWERFAEHRTTASGQPLRAPLLVQVNRITSRRGRPIVFVNASAADKPFGRFTTERKRAVGRDLLRRIRSTQ
jgi:hypothetical protein